MPWSQQRDSLRQRGCQVSEQPGRRLQAAPAAAAAAPPSSSSPRSPPSPWPPSFGSWPQTAAWKRAGAEDLNRKRLQQREQRCGRASLPPPVFDDPLHDVVGGETVPAIGAPEDPPQLRLLVTEAMEKAARETLASSVLFPREARSGGGKKRVFFFGVFSPHRIRIRAVLVRKHFCLAVTHQAHLGGRGEREDGSFRADIKPTEREKEEKRAHWP